MDTYPSSDFVKRFNQDIYDLNLELELLEVNTSFEIKKIPGMLINYKMIRQYLNAHSTRARKFVVRDHETAYEIARLLDKASTKLFYIAERNGKPKEEKIVDNDAVQKLKDTIDEYCHKTFNYIKKYSDMPESLFRQGAIPYGYLQKRLNQTAPFRTAKEGSTKKLKVCLEELLEQKYIGLVDSSKLETKMRLFVKL